MRRPSLVLLVLLPSVVLSDPHYVQELHPYWGHDENYNELIGGFDPGVNVRVRSSRTPDGDPVYIYIYAVRLSGAARFGVDVGCVGDDPESEAGMVSDTHLQRSDPVLDNEPPRITNDMYMTWELDPGAEQQGMWFYSENAPVDRQYLLHVEPSVAEEGATERVGTIQGPSCDQTEPRSEAVPH